MKKTSPRRHSSRTPRRRSDRSRNLVFAILIIGGAFYFVRARVLRPAPLQIAEVGNTPTGTVSLSLSPSQLNLNPGQETDLALDIDTGGSKVAAVQVELSYDPASLSITSVTPSDFLTVSLLKPKIQSDLVTFVLAAAPESGGKSGSGRLATLKVRSVTAGTSTLNFTGGTMVAAVESTSNALNQASGATVISGTADNPATANAPVLTNPASSPNQPVTPAGKPDTSPGQTNSELAPGNPDPTLAPVNFGQTRKAAMTDPNTPASQSGFARFLAWIRVFFGRLKP